MIFIVGEAVKKIILGMGLLFVFSVSLIRCNGDEDIGIIVNDPTVNIFFLNADSLLSVTDTLGALNVASVESVGEIVELESKADTLLKYNLLYRDSIYNQGREDLIPKLDSIQNDSIAVKNKFDVAYGKDTILTNNKTYWTAVEAKINSGAVLVSSIENISNGRKIASSDSSTIWNVPLDMNNSEVALRFTIDQKKYDLALGYSQRIITDEKNRVIIAIENINIVQSTFSASKINCNSCLDSETTIYVEF